MILLALLLIIAGGVGAHQLSRPAPEPGEVAGLRTQPSRTWSYQLQEGLDVDVVPVGDDHALVMPVVEPQRRTVPMSMIKLTNSKELWRREVAVSSEGSITGGWIPGTDHVYLLEGSHLPGSLVTVLDIETGAVIASRSLLSAESVTAIDGALFLLGAHVSRLDPETLETRWEVDLPYRPWVGGARSLTVRSEHVLIMSGDEADSPGPVLSAHAVSDGTPPPWQPSDDAQAWLIGDQVVHVTRDSGEVRLSGVAPDGSVVWQETVAALVGVTKNTLLKAGSGDRVVSNGWSRMNPADGTELWASPYEASGIQSLREMHGLLVVVDPSNPGVVVLDRDTGAETMRAQGRGFQTVWFEAENDRLVSVSALENGGRRGPDGSLSSASGVRLRAIDLEDPEAHWTWEIHDPVRIVQCGSRLLAIDLGTGRIRGIA